MTTNNCAQRNSNLSLFLSFLPSTTCLFVHCLYVYIFTSVPVCTCTAPHQCLFDRSRFRVSPCYRVRSLSKCCSLLNTFIYFHSLLWSSINHFPPSVSNYPSLALIYLPLSGSDTSLAFPSPPVFPEISRTL